MSALAELYTLPQEHLDLRDTIRQIAVERIAPRAAKVDERADYPRQLRELRELRELLSEQDILGLPFESEHGADFYVVFAVTDRKLGGYGYVKEYPVERMLRDAKISRSTRARTRSSGS